MRAVEELIMSLTLLIVLVVMKLLGVGALSWTQVFLIPFGVFVAFWLLAGGSVAFYYVFEKLDHNKWL